jgi:hypothetical protein
MLGARHGYVNRQVAADRSGDGRVGTLADSPGGRTSAELAKICGISTSTCALVLGELERGSK